MKLQFSEAMEMTVAVKKNLERFQYWQGQRLRASDFNRIAGDDAQRRWWHNRALHNAWGIYRGFKVTPLPNAKKATSIHVESGLAYDSFGRELVLESAREVPVPENIQNNFGASRTITLRLLLGYPEQSTSSSSCAAPANCWPQTSSTRSANVQFQWIAQDAARQSDGIVLGDLHITPRGENTFEVNTAPARTMPLARPLLATGSTPPGNTFWGSWPLDSNSNDFQSSISIGVQTNIDSSAAGFTSLPCYFAWLQGPLWNSSTQQLLPAFFPSLANETSSGFTFRLLFPVLPRGAGRDAGSSIRAVANADDFLAFAHRQKLYVAWVGCQMPPQVPFISFQQGISNLNLLKEILVRS
jgi:hypothetical protein